MLFRSIRFSLLYLYAYTRCIDKAYYSTHCFDVNTKKAGNPARNHALYAPCRWAFFFGYFSKLYLKCTIYLYKMSLRKRQKKEKRQNHSSFTAFFVLFFCAAVSGAYCCGHCAANISPGASSLQSLQRASYPHGPLLLA